MLFVSRDNEVFADSTSIAATPTGTRVISKTPGKSSRVFDEVFLPLLWKLHVDEHDIISALVGSR